MLRKLIIDRSNEVFKYYFNAEKATDDSTKKPIIDNLSKINVFIGPNNSGKSRFIRELFKQFSKENFNDNDLDYPICKFKQFQNRVEQLLQTKYSQKEINDKLDFKSIGNELYAKKHSNILSTLSDDFDSPKPKSFHEKVEKFIAGEKEKSVFLATYVPVLRSIKKISKSNTDSPLHQRTWDDYFKEKQILYSKFAGFSGERIFNITEDYLLSHFDDREIIRDIERFFSEFFFEGKRVSFIPRKKLDTKDKDGKSIENQNQDLFVRIEEEEFPIQELGDGIQTLIILTFPLFLRKNENHLLFIEEPEQNLHPGLQRIFIEALCDERFKNTQVFLTTHSTHFLDITLEKPGNISIFNFKKDFPEEDKSTPNFEIRNVHWPDNPILGELGIRNSSVFLANCTIWVEGITDRLYINKYLKIYLETERDQLIEKYDKPPQFIEDLHYSFVEYSGSNISHWEFSNNDETEDRMKAPSISNKIFLIADADYYKEEGKYKIPNAKSNRNEKLKKILDNSFCLLKVREIENTLKKETVSKFVNEKEKPNGFNLDDISDEDYKKGKIGENINASLNKTNNGKKKKIEDYQKYISDNKVGFFNNIEKYIENKGDLSEEAERLCEKLVVFIYEHNK